MRLGWRLLTLASLVTSEALGLKIQQDVKVQEFPLLMPKAKPSQAESYLCTPIRMDTEDTYFVTGFKPNATKMTAHHMLIYGCEEPGAELATWDCGEMAARDPGQESHPVCAPGSASQIIFAWAMDAPELELPPGVGFRVGGDSSIKYLVLQVHYASTDYIDAAGDDSGVILRYTEQELPKTAGVLLMGTGGSAPAHSTTYFETSCDIEDSRVIHPFAFRTHTHSLGKVVSGWKVDRSDTWTLIGKRDPQKPQMFYPITDSGLTLTQGDRVAARCTMVNHRDRITAVGATNEDEMCNFYIMYWVDGPVPMDKGTCFTPGPPLWSWGGSWLMGGGLRNIPDKEASTL